MDVLMIGLVILMTLGMIGLLAWAGRTASEGSGTE